MIFVVVAAVACVLASIFQCNPIHKAWDAAGTIPGRCINVNALFFANAGLDIVQDAIIYILPMRMLYKLQIPKRQKIALMMVFAVGGFVVITGMVRLNSLKIAQNTPDPSCEPVLSYKLMRNPNIHPDNNFGAAVWSAIESNIGVVCASLPHFKPLIDRFFPNLMGSNRDSCKRIPLHNGPAGPAPPKRSYAKAYARTENYELEHGSGWNKPFGGNCDATAGSTNQSGTDSTEDHVGGVDSHGREGGILASTSIVISHG